MPASPTSLPHKRDNGHRGVRELPKRRALCLVANAREHEGHGTSSIG